MVAVPRSLRERRVFVDSSAYLALLDQKDEYHSTAASIARRLAEQRYRQFTTNAVIMESHALILSALGIRIASAFLQGMEQSNTAVIRVRATDETRAKLIIFAYDDKGFSYVDALSFAVMERLGISRAFTFDKHFSQFGFGDLSSLAVDH